MKAYLILNLIILVGSIINFQLESKIWIIFNFFFWMTVAFIYGTYVERNDKGWW